jgi:uncharacterized Zn finger protein (UPF0148 family)
MSDTESGDDDGFDREAEKERLREKYEQDKQDRQATEHMSELLLKGATMTNRHCDDCGNPIFRYDGQEFCSVCGEGGQEGATDGQQAGTGKQQTAAGQQPATGGQPAADQKQPGTGQPADADQGAPGGQQPGAADERTAAGQQPAAAGRSDAARTPQFGQGAQSGQPTPQATAGDADLDAARASLARTITQLSRRAEETRDAGHARDLLAAAREAAETLAELERLR